MSEPLYVSRARVAKVERTHRRLDLEAGATVDVGVHGPIKALFKHYTLRIPPGSRETVERALSRHQDKCPTARSLRNAIRIEWTADVQEGV